MQKSLHLQVSPSTHSPGTLIAQNARGCFAEADRLGNDLETLAVHRTDASPAQLGEQRRRGTTLCHVPRAVAAARWACLITVGVDLAATAQQKAWQRIDQCAAAPGRRAWAAADIQPLQRDASAKMLKPRVRHVWVVRDS